MAMPGEERIGALVSVTGQFPTGGAKVVPLIAYSTPLSVPNTKKPSSDKAGEDCTVPEIGRDPVGGTRSPVRAETTIRVPAFVTPKSVD